MAVTRPHEDRLGTSGAVADVLTYTGTGVATWAAAPVGVITDPDIPSTIARDTEVDAAVTHALTLSLLLMGG